MLALIVALAHAHPHPDCPEAGSPPPPVGITVVLAGDARHAAIQVSCPGGFEGRAPFVHEAAQVAPTPFERCQVTLEGGREATVEARAGAKLLCTRGADGLTQCMDVDDALHGLGHPLPARGGDVTIEVAPDLLYTAVEVSCEGGFRERATFSDSVAVVTDVPAEKCRAKLKGGTPMSMPVTGGARFLCQGAAPHVRCLSR